MSPLSSFNTGLYRQGTVPNDEWKTVLNIVVVLLSILLFHSKQTAYEKLDGFFY